uniref:YkuD like protein n=1 Tax=Geladintestivirus 6 TaxID=3233138 RepID=A0AAU8MHY0_9CAUD
MPYLIKKNAIIQVFDRDNKLLYTTKDVSTGKSSNDYNTVTYVDENGVLKDYQGNNSTPAGITTITSRGEYHEHPSFTRGRRSLDGTIEDIASAMHYANTDKKKASNGCVRVGSKSIEEISKYLGVGDQIYTLPEQAGSKFVLRAGKLNFVADNPYGKTEGDKKYWDDYNVQIDKSYSPLVIKPKGNGNEEHDKNQLDYANTLSTNKQKLQAELNLSSSEYNRLAQLAMGLAEQESNFGTGTSWDPRRNYKLKQNLEGLVRLVKGGEAASIGYTQIKYDNDIKNKDLKKLYDSYGVTKENLRTPQGAAVATMLRLGFVYNNEIKGGQFKDEKGKRMNLYDALLYKYNGRHKTLKSGHATPESNVYIKNVKAYANQNDYFEERKYRK